MTLDPNLHIKTVIEKMNKERIVCLQAVNKDNNTYKNNTDEAMWKEVLFELMKIVNNARYKNLNLEVYIPENLD